MRFDAGSQLRAERSSTQNVRPYFAGMISCCAVLSRSRAMRAKVRRWHGQGLQTVPWREDDLRQEGWRPLGTYHDASDPEHGEATIYIKDDAVRICHSIYGPVPCSDGVILQHDEDVYDVQMGGMQGRIDAEGFHCSGYLNPTVAAAAPPPATPEPEVSRQPMTSAPITEPKLQKACRNLAAILGPGAFPKEDYESMMNQGSASDALLSEVKAMGDDYGGWAAFEASREHEETPEQHISGKRHRQLRREIRSRFFVPGAGRFFEEVAYDSWRQQQNARWLPTVTELRTEGYMLTHFEELQKEAEDAADCVRRTLLTGSEQLVSYVLRYYAFWAVDQHARRLDEVEEAVRADAAALKNKPKVLLLRIERERKKRLAAERAKRDKPFEHLQMIPPLPVPGEALEFRVLSSEEQVREAAERLKNCAATYIPDVVAQKCALVGLFPKQKGDRDKASKIFAMGELFVNLSEHGKIVTRWGQRVKACNKSVTKRQKISFNWAGRRFSELWTKAIEYELDEVLPKQASGETAMAESADRVLSAFGRLSSLGLKSLANRSLLSELSFPCSQLVGALTEPLLSAAEAGDDSFARSIISQLLKAGVVQEQTKAILQQALRLDQDAKLTVLLSELPFPCSQLVGALTEPLLSAAKAGDDSLARSIISKLLKAGVAHEQTNSIFQQALRLKKNAKLTVLLSELPFPCSNLVGALTKPLLSAAKVGDDSLTQSIISKLLKAGVAQDQTKSFFKKALRLDKDVKLRALLSEFPLRRQWSLLK
ncbi:unnamed protein product [Symbiodinium sp. CCMP2592]|nr:unnamed protein product [Symbiodinium sp. CCMP2592]